VSTHDVRTLLHERAEGLEVARPERVDEVMGRIWIRRRRRTGALVAASGMVALTLVVGAAMLTRDPGGTPTPIGPDTSTSVDPEPGPQAGPVRKVAYTDEYWPTLTLQVGSRTVDISAQAPPADPGQFVNDVVHMDVTDDGVGFTTHDGRIWFTDGSSVDQIGDAHHQLGWSSYDEVRSGTSGSLLAWTEWAADRRLVLVVYDTSAGREVARASMPGCTAGGCRLAHVVGSHVYWRTAWDRPPTTRYDVSTGQVVRVSQADLAADLAGQPRGLIVGDSPETGVATEGHGQRFLVEGRRLEPVLDGRVDDNPAYLPTTAFAAGTLDPLELRLPAGYEEADEFTAFQWVDDDRLALMNAANELKQTTGDILVCRVSTGQCELAAGPKAPGDTIGDEEVELPRVAPHLPLPG